VIQQKIQTVQKMLQKCRVYFNHHSQENNIMSNSVAKFS